MKKTFSIATIFALAFLGWFGVVLGVEVTGTLGTGGSSGGEAGGVAPTLSSGPSASKTGDNQITVNWGAAAGAEGYKVFRLKVEDGTTVSTTPVAELDGSITSHTDSNLDDGTYAYQVQPFLDSLEPELSNTSLVQPSNIVTVSTPSPTPAPTGGGGGGGGGSATTTTTSTPTPTPGPLSEEAQKVDVNNGGDGKIDVLDFTVLMINWGSSDSGNTADFNEDGVIDILDFTLLMIHWTG